MKLFALLCKNLPLLAAWGNGLHEDKGESRGTSWKAVELTEMKEGGLARKFILGTEKKMDSNIFRK